jgi:DNA-directed RNA polymerase specialized sigma24 family protein
MPPEQYPAPDWEELRKRAVGILRRVAWGWDPTDWEDMAQEAVLNTIVAMANNQVDMQQFNQWFYKVVVNVSKNWARRHRREAPLLEGHEPEDEVVDAEIKNALLTASEEMDIRSVPTKNRLKAACL